MIQARDMKGVGVPLTEDEDEEVTTKVGGGVGLQVYFDLSHKNLSEAMSSTSATGASGQRESPTYDKHSSRTPTEEYHW